MSDTKTLRDKALAIFHAGLRAVDPFEAVHRNLALDGHMLSVGAAAEPEVIDLSAYRRIVVVGAGKASARMCQALEEVLGRHISAGVVSVKTGYTASLDTVELVEADHPVPSNAGKEAVERMVKLLSPLGSDSLVVALISGGGSALLPLPAPPVTLADKQEMTDLLLRAGATINQMNCVRKHISNIKGGWLARHAHPAHVLTLILSDVVGDPLDVIASGPTVPDESTFADAAEVLVRFDLWSRAPQSVVERLRAGKEGKLPDTPKRGDPVFAHCRNVLVGTNSLALRACCEEAKKQGFSPLLLSSLIEGETTDVARVHAAIAKEIRRSGSPLAAPACVVSGGETTVTLRGNGMGGRNQEFALAAALEIDGEPSMAIMSGGTDGTDGPNDAAGAIAFGDTLSRARDLQLNARAYLDNNDSYHFFDTLGDLIRTGPTNTNVMDVHLLLVT